MGWAKAASIGLVIAFVAFLSTAAAQAQSFYVTTSKAVYEEGERVVVAGTVSNAGDRSAVLVKITSNDDECARQNVRPMRDGSFISRPMIITGCSPGEFKATAAHAGSAASTYFTVEAERKATDDPELRAMRDAVAQAQNAANTRVREVLNANLAIPSQAAEAYGRGVSEASFTLQAIDRGSAEVASRHMTAALAHFMEAFDLLSPEKLNAFAENVREEEARVSVIQEWFGRLQDLFRKLVNLADKNDVAAEQEFRQIGGFLDGARQLIIERNTDDASDLLQSADELLEEAREKMVQQAKGDDSQAQALTSAAERLASSAQALREEAAGTPRALAQINASFILINGAKSSIGEGNYDSAKASLDAAIKKIEEVREILRSRR